MQKEELELTDKTIILSIDSWNAESLKISRTDPRKGIELAEQALNSSRQNKYSSGEACSLANIGGCHIWLGNYENSLEHSYKALHLAQQQENCELQSQILYNVFCVFYFLADFDNALKYILECYRVSRQNEDVGGMANALNGIGTVYYTTGENKKAVENLEEALRYSRECADRQIESKILDGLGAAWFNLGEYEKSIEYRSACLEIVSGLGVKQIESYALDGIGTAYFYLKDFPNAATYFEKSLAIRRTMGFKAGEAETCLHLGELYTSLGKFEPAFIYLEEALSTSTAIEAREVIYKSHKAFADFFEKNSDIPNFIHHLREFYRCKEDYFSHKNNQKQRSLELQFRMEKVEQERSVLESRNKELEAINNDVVLLSELGQKIISCLSIESINQTIYEILNTMMDAPSFGIGMYHKESHTIHFPGYIEENIKLDEIVYDADDDRLTCTCFNEDREILISDLDKEMQLYVKEKKAPLAGRHVQSVLYLPLKIKDKIIGVITAQSFKQNAYATYHLNLLKNLGVYAAIALENAQLYEGLEAMVEERSREVREQRDAVEQTYKITKLLSDIGRKVTGSLKFEEVFRELYSSIHTLMPAECFGIRLYRPDLDAIEYRLEIERGEEVDDQVFVPMSNENNHSVWCVKNREVIFINDLENEYRRYTREIVIPSGDMPHSVIFYPLMYGDKILGAITVQSFHKNAYTPYHIDILKSLATYAAIAIENVNMYENLELKIKERTAEVVQQKEEVEKAYQNTHLLSEIGKKITSTLSVEEIITRVYEEINQVMDAAAFGIGIYRSEENDLFHPCVMENGVKLPPFSLPANNERIAGRCFFENKEYVIKNWPEEYSGYVSESHAPVAGKSPVSLIYLPIVSKERTMGVLSVQSFKVNAYTEFHLNFIRNLSVYIASALENASLYEDMEEKVKERTSEIQKAYENTRLLGQISKEISASLSIEGIISKVYESVNSLMDAAGFGIFIYEEENNRIRVPGFIENGEKLPEVFVNTDEQRLICYCLNNQREILINNYSEEYHLYMKGKQPPKAGKDAMSIIYVPMFVKDRIIGAMTVQSFQVNAYSEYHLDILRNIAVSTAIALENAKLYESMEERVRERTGEIRKAYDNTKLLSEIGRNISSLLSVEEIIQTGYENINNLMDATTFGIGIYRREHNDLFFSGAMEKGNHLDDFSFKLDDGNIASRSFLNEEEIVINDWKKEHLNYIARDYDAVVGDFPESMIYLPLHSKGKAIGVLTIQSFQKNAYEEYHHNIIRNLAVYIGTALENASLYENLEERVAERTDEIQQAYENTRLLSEIQKAIASSLTIEAIVSKVYESVYSLMDAAGFGVGYYDEKTRMIHLPGYFEKGKRIDNVAYPVDDENRLAAVCFNKKMEVIINDYEKDYVLYIRERKAAIAGQLPESIVYLPLISKEKAIGVLTVQSFNKNAFSEYQLNLIRNLASSISVALENARLYQSLEEKVKERTAEVVKQKEVIEEKNKHITDSIVYAKRIQQAILPPEDIFKMHFKNSFILYKPKDIVSGDFYWMEKKGNRLLFAVVDCTGHGVPGAFMSIIGYNGLNQIVNEYNITEPAEILNKLNGIITSTLKQKEDESKIRDGMDLSICCVDLESNKLEFAGANNPIFIVRNNQVMEIKADKQPIGNYIGEKEFRFTNKEIELLSEDRLYVFSDGYADQFGGPRGKKLKYNTFRDLLIEYHKLPMEDQKSKLDKMFESWRGDLEQIDDVCIIGVSV